MDILKKIIKDKNGLAMTEFVIVAPVLLILLFGILEFGLVLYDKAVLTNAAREGARHGIVFFDGRDEATIETNAVNAVTFYCDNNHLYSFDSTAAIDPDADVVGSETGSILTVTVTYPYKFLVFAGLMKIFGSDGTITLSAESVMRLE